MVKSPFLHTSPTNGLLTWLCCAKNDKLSKTKSKVYLSKSKVVPLCIFKYSDSLATPHVALLSRIPYPVSRLRNREHQSTSLSRRRIFIPGFSKGSFPLRLSLIPQPAKVLRDPPVSQLVTPIQSIPNLIMQL